MNCVVYFVQAESGPIKIGFSADLPKRLGAIQAGMPELVSLLAQVRGDRRTEFYLHQRFHSQRIVGEWFKPSPGLLSLIDEIKARGEAALPDGSRPLEEFSGVMPATDDLKEECRYYAMQIAGLRAPDESMKALITKAATITGLPRPIIKRFWYRQYGSVHAWQYLRLREVFEAREAIRMHAASAVGRIVSFRQAVDRGIGKPSGLEGSE